MLGEADLPEVPNLRRHFLHLHILHEGGIREMSLGEGGQYQYHRLARGAPIDI
jgi:hypothetical protein